MGRITACVDEKIVFIAEAEHRMNKATLLFVSEDFADICEAPADSSLLSIIVRAQCVANSLGTRLVLKQEGFIGGVFCSMSEMKEGRIKRKKPDKKKRNQRRG